MTVSANIQAVRERVQAALDRSGSQRELTVVAVTKEATVEQVRAARGAEIRDFGENRVQDAGLRIDAVTDARWHFIGHLQTNKVKPVVERFSLIHSVDSERLANRISAAGQTLSQTVSVLLQINVSGETSKFGISPDLAPELLEHAITLTGLRVCGLMTIAPYDPEPERARPHFSRLAELRERLSARYPEVDLSQLSMGMTDDFEVAIEEGATIVRIGRAIFGERR